MCSLKHGQDLEDFWPLAEADSTSHLGFNNRGIEDENGNMHKAELWVYE